MQQANSGRSILDSAFSHPNHSISVTEQEHIDETARRFAVALVKIRFEEAHGLLAPDLQSYYSVDVLAQKMNTLTPYAKREPDKVADPFSIGEANILDDGDLNIVSVPISGNDFNDAVILTMIEDSNCVKIREIGCRRP